MASTCWSATPGSRRSATAPGSASAPMRRRSPRSTGSTARSRCRSCSSMVFVAVLSAVVGFLILRRRGVYFSLLTLALAALTYTIAFRWTAVTGGEDGLGGLERGSLGPINLDDALAYYVFVALIGLGVLYVLLRVTRSPFGHVLVAIRENQQRATFQGYPVERYKLAAFVLSAVVTGLAGALLGLPELSRLGGGDLGRLLRRAAGDGGDRRHAPHPRPGARRRCSTSCSASCSRSGRRTGCSGSAWSSSASCCTRPSGLVGIWATLRRRWRPPPEEAAAMSRRRDLRRPAAAGVPAPASGRRERCWRSTASRSTSAASAPSSNASLAVDAGEIHALIGPNGAGKTTLFNLVSGLFPPDAGTVRLNGREIHGSAAAPHLPARPRALVPDHQPVPRPVDLREPAPVAAGAASRRASTPGATSTAIPEIHAETAELIRFLGLEGIEEIEGGELSYGGQRLVDLGIALGSKPQVLLLDEPLAGLAAAERERVSNLVRNVAANIPVLIVEHDIDRVLGFSQRVTVMNQGEVLMTGTPDEVRADRRVQEVYTGTGTPPVTGRVCATRHASAQCAALRGRQRLLRQEPHPQRRDARRARGRDRGAARPQRRRQVDAAEDAGGAGAAGLRHASSTRAATSPGCRRPTSRASASATCRRAAACSPA